MHFFESNNFENSTRAACWFFHGVLCAYFETFNLSKSSVADFSFLMSEQDSSLSCREAERTILFAPSTLRLIV